MQHGGQNKNEPLPGLTGVKETPSNISMKNSLVTILLFLFIVVSTARLPELFPYKIAIIIGIMTIAAYFMSPGKKNCYKLGEYPELICLIIIAILVGLSVPLSVWPGNSFRFIVDSYIKMVIIFYILIKSIIDLKKIRTMAYAFAFSSVILAILVFFKGSTAESWRMYFGSYDPNDTALVFVTTMPFLFVFFNSSSRYSKVFWLASIVFLTVTLFLTGSRGGVLGFIAVSILIFIKWSKRHLVYYIFLSVLIISVVSRFIPEAFWQRFSSIERVESDQNIQSRFEAWKTGMQFMAKKPIFGVGVMGFTVAEGMSHKEIGGPWWNAHNSFIQIGGELGIGGLICFVLVFYFLIRRLARISKTMRSFDENEFLPNLIIGLRISFIGFLVCSFFLSQAYSPLFYNLIGLTIAISAVCKKGNFEVKNL